METVKMPESSDLLKPEEVAERLRVNRHTIYAWLRSGQLKGTHVGRGWRIHVDDLIAFLRQ